MLERRVGHRMRQTDQATYAQYADRLDAVPAERALLKDAVLIRTTQMFRGERTFAALRQEVVTELLLRRIEAGASDLRLWSAACSTGEEAWSLAICVADACERLGAALPFSIVASDTSETALAKARAGVLSAETVDVVPPALRDRWILPQGSAFVPHPTLREAVAFVRHDLLDETIAIPHESVVSSFDLVSCRNLLIYLRPGPQRAVVTRLLEACTPGAVFLLDESENLPSPPPRPVRNLVPGASVWLVEER